MDREKLEFVSATTALVVVVLSATLALLVLIGVGGPYRDLRKHRWTLLKVVPGGISPQSQGIKI